MNPLTVTSLAVIMLAAISSNMYASELEPSSEALPCETHADEDEVMAHVQPIQFVKKVHNA